MQLQKFSHDASVSSYKTYSCLESDFSAVNAINKTFNFLIKSRGSSFDVRRKIQQVAMILPIVRHMSLKGISPAITFAVLKKI